MLDAYPPSARMLAEQQHAFGLPLLVWLGDDGPLRDPERRDIAAQLANLFGGVLLVDKSAA